MMNYKNIPQEYDEIYLQANLEEHDPEEFDLNGVTWCADWVYEDDVKYLLATPEREAVPDLLEALGMSKEKLNLAIAGDDWGLVDRALYIIDAAIARATTPEEERG